jgi:hypothetical protein
MHLFDPLIWPKGANLPNRAAKAALEKGLVEGNTVLSERHAILQTTLSDSMGRFK